MCFTNYMWNERLSCAFARAIKRHRPRTVVVMGGPNYPVDACEQQAYLADHPEIDFFVDGEGEVAFVNLFQALADADFDADRLRRHGTAVPGVHYVADGQFVRGETLPRILDLDRTLPSPYTTGLLDEFFDDRLTPMMQTSRGCPYSCTFCHDGIAYMNKTRAFSLDRVDEELAYIEARVEDGHAAAGGPELGHVSRRPEDGRAPGRDRGAAPAGRATSWWRPPRTRRSASSRCRACWATRCRWAPRCSPPTPRCCG